MHIHGGLYPSEGSVALDLRQSPPLPIRRRAADALSVTNFFYRATLC